MRWRGIVGESFDRKRFAEYVRDLKLVWRPSVIVLHNTYRPTLVQWHGKTPPAQRMKNLEVYYRDQKGWSAGPHLFVADDLIWVFSPLTHPGVHSPSWNRDSWGVEIVGDYDVEEFRPETMENVVCALDALFRKIEVEPTSKTLKFHKEDPRTSHKNCPGKNVSKTRILEALRKRRGENG